MCGDKKRGGVWSFFIALCVLTVSFSALAEMEIGGSENRAAAGSVELDRYVLQAGPITLGKGLKNVSGLTCNPLSESLFLVRNRPTEIIEIDFHGAEKRVISLRGFHDTEGITHIRGNTFAVVEEKRRTICVIEINQDTTAVDRDDSKAIILVEPASAGNKGLEGISYDPLRGRFYVVKEKGPRMLYQLSWPVSFQGLEISNPWDIQKKSLALSDLSGVHSLSGGRNLLILSDESAAVVEATLDGEELSRLSLKRGGKSGLREDVPQAEGVTMDTRGWLFICSEPDLLYVFNRLSSNR